MIKGFKDFIMRGNVVDLAVAVVIGAAFGAVVTSLVDNIINPLIAALVGKPDLSAFLAFTLKAAEGETPATVLAIGTFLTAALNFLIIAAAIYFMVVMPLNKLAERRKKGEEPAPVAPAEDVLLLTEIRDLLAKKAVD